MVAVATGFIGIYSFELHFPESHSLKEKRMQLRSVKAQLTNRVACSIAEVDHQTSLKPDQPQSVSISTTSTSRNFMKSGWMTSARRALASS